MRSSVMIACAIAGASLLSFPAIAQQKTVKACQEEWRANKDANQAKGVTEKAYVTQCRAAGSATTTPAPSTSQKKTASEKKTSTAAPPAADGQKTAKACRDEWRANKDANQAKGVTEKAYITQCRSGGTVAAPAPAPAPAPTPTRTTTAPNPFSATASYDGRSSGCDNPDGCQSVRDRRAGETAMPHGHRGLGQPEFEDLSLQWP